MSEVEMPDIVGRTITAVRRADDGDGIVLTLDDGRQVTLVGDGYDGLWRYVSWEVTA